MQLDPASYLHHLHGFDLTAPQKAEIVRSIHQIMEGFVDIAFGVDATQLSLGTSGNSHVGGNADAVNSNDTLISTFNDAAREGAAGTSAS